MSYVTILDAPTLPQELLEALVKDFWESLRDTTRQYSLGLQHLNNDPEYITYVEDAKAWHEKYGYGCGVENRYLDKTLHKEITDFYKDYPRIANATLHYNHIFGEETFYPHVDGFTTRDSDANILYNVIISGGDENYTVFYEPKDEYKHLKIEGDIIIPPEKLNEVYRYKMPVGQWQEFGAFHIHGSINVKNRPKVMLVARSF